jgi:imidazolonepropionase-like amidohydrolase
MRRLQLAVALLSVVPLARLDAQSYDKLSSGTRAMVMVPDSVFALMNVRVVDGTGAPVKENQMILVRNGRIAYVGPSASPSQMQAQLNVPANYRAIDFTNRATVIHGIVGMHNHTFYTTARRSIQANFSMPRLYLASGVTTARTTGSMSPYSELNLKKRIDSGEVPGPRMHVTGPYISGDGAGAGMYEVGTPDDARRVVAYWAKEGATWFKFYTLITREEMKAAIDEAHKHGLKVTGHLCSVGFREAVALGIDALEHSLFANSEYDPNKQPDKCPATAEASLAKLDMQSPQVKATIDDMVKHKVAMTSTMAIYELYVPGRPAELDPRMLEAMSPETREEYLASRKRIADNPQVGTPEIVLKKAMEFDRMFVKAGGLLAAGSDPTGMGGALPGFGDQRNHELLVEAGFTPIESIKIMTLNGAKVLGVDKDLGSIETGKIADLVVIEGKPDVRPADIRNTQLVFKDGVGYETAKLLAAIKGVVGIR